MSQEEMEHLIRAFLREHRVTTAHAFDDLLRLLMRVRDASSSHPLRAPPPANLRVGDIVTAPSFEGEGVITALQSAKHPNTVRVCWSDGSIYDVSVIGLKVVRHDQKVADSCAQYVADSPPPANPIELDNQELDLCGPVTAEEAGRLAQQFIDGHFNNAATERPHIEIPANRKRDSDLRLLAYIAQSKATIAQQAQRIAELEGEMDAAWRALNISKEDRETNDDPDCETLSQCIQIHISHREEQYTFACARIAELEELHEIDSVDQETIARQRALLKRVKAWVATLDFPLLDKDPTLFADIDAVMTARTSEDK